MTGMEEGRRNQVRVALTTPVRWAWEHARRRRQRPLPPEAGVREPRRPGPTLPAAAVALDEPRTEVRRWIKLISRHGTDPT